MPASNTTFTDGTNRLIMLDDSHVAMCFDKETLFAVMIHINLFSAFLTQRSLNKNNVPETTLGNIGSIDVEAASHMWILRGRVTAKHNGNDRINIRNLERNCLYIREDVCANRRCKKEDDI